MIAQIYSLDKTEMVIPVVLPIYASYNLGDPA